MRTFLTLVCLLFFINISAQKYITRSGSINFEASVPSFEEVAAKHNSVTAIINADNGEFASLALVKGFRFKNALMEEHFNENYAESEDFPKATFKGKIRNFKLSDLGSSAKEYSLDGEMEFHGETHKYNDLRVMLSKDGKNIKMEGEFVALASDFKIKIPKIVSSKLRDDVNVVFNFNFSPQ